MARDWREARSAADTPDDTVDAVEKQAVKAGLEIFFDSLDDMEKPD